jgi:sigma-B regulation protein RsbU (phosphoserine phosphatase)
MPRLLLYDDGLGTVSDVRTALQRADFTVDARRLPFPEADGVEGFQLVIVDTQHNVADALAFCRRFRAHLGDAFLPLLFITSDGSPAARLASLESGADAYLLRPFDSAELLALVRALLRGKERHDGLVEKTAEVHRINKRLQQAYQQIDQELELARRIQESFLPRSLPQVAQVRFAVHYQPCGKVGGDFYDIFRLDEKHLGFYVADAMGHGVPASLLTIFVKTGVRAKEITGQSYRLVPPDEVLHRLNRDLIEQHLSDSPFITMVYALFDHRELTLSFSRAGHPYPLYVPREGEPQLWTLEGSLLGVFDTKYTVRKAQLQPGDKVLLYTDGVDAAIWGDAQPGIASLLAFAAEHRGAKIDDFVRLLSQELFKNSKQVDDLTVLGLEVEAG